MTWKTKTAPAYFVRGLPCSGVDGIVVGNRRGKWNVPGALLISVDHSLRAFCDHVIDALDAADGAGVVEAGVDIYDANALVDGGGNCRHHRIPLSKMSVAKHFQRKVYSSCR